MEELLLRFKCLKVTQNKPATYVCIQKANMFSKETKQLYKKNCMYYLKVLIRGKTLMLKLNNRSILFIFNKLSLNIRVGLCPIVTEVRWCSHI